MFCTTKFQHVLLSPVLWHRGRSMDLITREHTIKTRRQHAYTICSTLQTVSVNKLVSIIRCQKQCHFRLTTKIWKSFVKHRHHISEDDIHCCLLFAGTLTAQRARCHLVITCYLFKESRANSLHLDTGIFVRFLALTLAVIKMTVFRDVAPCSLVEVYLWFRAMIEATSTAEISVYVLPDYTVQQLKRTSSSQTFLSGLLRLFWENILDAYDIK
jgi:hypothetical protein